MDTYSLAPKVHGRFVASASGILGITQSGKSHVQPPPSAWREPTSGDIYLPASNLDRRLVARRVPRLQPRHPYLNRRQRPRLRQVVLGTFLHLPPFNRRSLLL